MRIGAIVITCEHAGNRVPRAYAHLFRSPRAKVALDSHRGHDPGALQVARACARTLGTAALTTTVTRLLVETNRSAHHPRLFSEFTSALPDMEKERVVALHYTPHRERVEAALREQLKGAGSVLHVAVHSFTPVLDGKVRNAELGLLYDPRRRAEQALATRWQAELEALTELRVRRNYPYHGASDGLTTYLRRALGPRYLGFELELNQRLLTGDERERRRVTRVVCESLEKLANRGSG